MSAYGSLAPYSGRNRWIGQRSRPTANGPSGLARRVAGNLFNQVARRALRYGINRANTRRNASTQTSASTPASEQNIGTGLHDAFLMYKKRGGRSRVSRRKRYRSRRISRSLRKNQKRLVRRIARGVSSVPTKKSATSFNSMVELAAVTDTQAFAVLNSGSCYTGFQDLLHSNQWHTVFKEVFLQGDLSPGLDKLKEYEIVSKMKLRLLGQRNSLTVYNNNNNNQTLRVYEYVCKKTLPLNELGSSNQFAIGDVHTMANCRDLVVYGCGGEIDASNELISDGPYNIGWEPQRSIWLNKYFSLAKSTQYELGGYQKLVYNSQSKHGLTLNYKAISNNSFIKGVSRLFLFIGHGYPYFVSGTGHEAQSIAANNGIVIHHRSTLTWKPIMNTLDEMSALQKAKISTHESVSSWGTIDSVIRFDIA